MNSDKHSRTITLHCPTYTGTSFESDSPDSQHIMCVGCARVLSKDELRRENEENIQTHLDEIKRSVKQDVADELRKRLQKAFRGNKGFKLK
ncbi:ECs_2282 family putative zinc-binding protein [Pseudomonas putida]|uniref:ECs_2282 family putative zinc-binding protein n=1 Tax=Pseudomonas putida TaxID=303 RepID=UPI001F520181|nr:hypothetical protein [Pseudomonas putida]MCI1037725.1 hypothetical protein [Pseudomonas putida]